MSFYKSLTIRVICGAYGTLTYKFVEYHKIVTIY